ncbi:MAG: AraC family transcriptional regulator [FCB group bacterium]|jgi:AraC-like DNA-binding protein
MVDGSCTYCLVKSCESGSTNGSECTIKFKRALIILRNGYHSYDFNVNILLELTNYIESDLNNLIKFYFGHTIIGLIENVRLEKSLPLLDSNESIMDIALKCGYNDADVFSKAMKRRLSHSPMYYRKLFKQTNDKENLLKKLIDELWNNNMRKLF